MNTLETSSTLRQQARISADCATAFVLAAGLFIIAPSHALASGAKLSDTLSNVGEQLSSLPQFIQFIFYVVGIALVGRGLMSAKKISENPAQGGGVLGAVGPIGVGGLMIALPSVADLAMNSIYKGSSGGSSVDLTAIGDAGNGLTVGAAISNAAAEAFSGPANLYDLVSYVSYVVAILLFGSMLQGAYKLSSGAQGGPQVSGLAWRGIGAGLLIALPKAVSMIRDSIIDNASSAQDIVSLKVAAAGAADAGLDAGLVRLITDVREPLMGLVFLLAFFFGILIIAQTLYAMSGINFEKQQLTPNQMVTRLIFGGLLVSFYSLYEVVSTTVFGAVPEASTLVLAWSQDALNGDTATRVNNVMNAVFVWVQIVGTIAFLRGWFSLKGSLDGSANSPKSAGITQVIAGALCINMPATVVMIQNTLGVKILV